VAIIYLLDWIFLVLTSGFTIALRIIHADMTGVQFLLEYWYLYLIIALLMILVGFLQEE